MPTFAFEAMNSSGQEVKEEIEAAPDLSALLQRLVDILRVHLPGADAALLNGCLWGVRTHARPENCT